MADRRNSAPVHASVVVGERVSEHDDVQNRVGPHVDEVIDVLGLAMRYGLTAEAIKSTMFAYPTGASDLISKL